MNNTAMKCKWLSLLMGLCLVAPGSAAAQTPETSQVTVEVSNRWKKAHADAPVALRLDDLKPGFRVRSAVVMDGTTEIPSQLDDLDGDLKADELAFVIDVPAKSSKRLTITLSSARSEKNYQARVYGSFQIREAKKNNHQAAQSLTVPGTSNVYSLVIPHGPSFESELVGYRIYFNEKQTIDPYGKFHKGLELQESGFYPNADQLARGFGDDVLMVGNSCGVGALKGWDGQQATHITPVAYRTERMLAYGPIRTIAEVEVKGWDYQGSELTMPNSYILYAGHRALSIETRFAEPLGKEIFATGVQNIMGTETVSDSDHRGLVGSWGRHWPVTDTIHYAKETVGIATYIPQKYVRQEVKDKDNFLYTIAAPGSQELLHYTMFTSCKETFGFGTAQKWFAYMREWKEELEHPVEVTILR